MLKLLRKELLGRNFFVGGHNPSSRKNIENLSRIKKQKMSLEQKMKNVKVSSVDKIDRK